MSHFFAMFCLPVLFCVFCLLVCLCYCVCLFVLFHAIVLFVSFFDVRGGSIFANLGPGSKVSHFCRVLFTWFVLCVILLVCLFALFHAIVLFVSFL